MSVQVYFLLKRKPDIQTATWTAFYVSAYVEFEGKLPSEALTYL